MLWFYRYSITVALSGMVAVRVTRTRYLDRLLKRAAGIIAGRKATDTDMTANIEVAIPLMPQRIPKVHTDL